MGVHGHHDRLFFILPEVNIDAVFGDELDKATTL
jgi:hypothetical protein